MTRLLLAFLAGLVVGYRIGTQRHAKPRAAYWQQPGLAERIRKALADHEAGKSVPLHVEPDEPDWLAEFGTNGPPNAYRMRRPSLPSQITPPPWTPWDGLTTPYVWDTTVRTGGN